MTLFWLRSLLALSVLLALPACDTGRASLDEEEEETGGGGSSSLEGECSALIDGESFEARTASARINLVDDTERLDMTCDGGATDLIFSLQPAAIEPATIALGTPGNRVQLSVGDEVTITDGSTSGEVVLRTYTRDLVAGTFSFDVPSFDGEGDPIAIRRGQFRIELP